MPCSSPWSDGLAACATRRAAQLPPCGLDGAAARRAAPCCGSRPSSGNTGSGNTGSGREHAVHRMDRGHSGGHHRTFHEPLPRVRALEHPRRHLLHGADDHVGRLRRHPAGGDTRPHAGGAARLRRRGAARRPHVGDGRRDHGPHRDGERAWTRAGRPRGHAARARVRDAAAGGRPACRGRGRLHALRARQVV
eukprot:5706034-Prymnesium_polylepis.2